MEDGERHFSLATNRLHQALRTWREVDRCTCSCAWCLQIVWEWFISAGWEAQHLQSAHGSSPSKHKQAPILVFRPCSAPARQRRGKGSPWAMSASQSAVNIYVCFSLHMGKQDITETQLYSCLPRQHVLRYKYFYSFLLDICEACFGFSGKFTV